MQKANQNGQPAQWAHNLGQVLPQVNVTVRMSGDFPVSKENTVLPPASRGSRDQPAAAKGKNGVPL